MKSRLLILIPVSWFFVNVSWAATPVHVPKKGGLPECQAELAECTINLTDTEELLQVCEDDLAQCQATAGQAFPATGQTTSYWPGDDGDVRAGAALSYTDNGDGTITDNNTGLMWEKKDESNGIHDNRLAYTWVEAFDVHIATLNTGAFAGHTDWRVPNVKELQSIVSYENSNPAVSPEFDNNCGTDCRKDSCSCTTTFYWSSTSNALNTDDAYDVFFGNGFVTDSGKTAYRLVRAVRGGR